MATERNPLNLFLPTHPKRGFKKGDRVLHNGQGASYRGLVGVVSKVSQGGHDNKIIIQYDNAYRDEVDYTIAWALENLLVCTVDLMEKSCGPEFNQEYFVGKYYSKAITSSTVASSGKKHPISHAGLKQLVEAAIPRNRRYAHAQTGIRVYSSDKAAANAALKKQLRELQRNSTNQPQLELELEMPHIPVEMPQLIAIEIDLHSPAPKFLVMQLHGDDNQRSVVSLAMTMDEIKQLPVGRYETYALYRNLEVKPKAQTELVWG